MMVVTGILTPAAIFVLSLAVNDGQLSAVGVIVTLGDLALGIFGPLLWLRRRARAVKRLSGRASRRVRPRDRIC
jgi:hypothetical protein